MSNEPTSPPEWSYEIRGTPDVRDKPYEYVIHLDDDSREWNSWGWGGDHRIIVFGSGVGQNQSYNHSRALAITHLLTAAPKLLAACRAAISGDPEHESWTAVIEQLRTAIMEAE